MCYTHIRGHTHTHTHTHTHSHAEYFTLFLSCFIALLCLNRYASRCLMVEFSEPPLDIGICNYMKLAELWKSCSGCIGFCIELGSRFFNSGYIEVDDEILKQLSSKAPHGISPRVLPGYAILFWFAREVR